jgi:hypothetical protein
MNIQACARCVRAHRACSWFKDEGTLLFRHYQPVTPSKSISCNSELEAAALDIFVSDFFIKASDRALSRDFDDGMQNVLKTLGPGNPLVLSAKLIALANVAKQHSHKKLLGYVETCYGGLLRNYLKLCHRGLQVFLSRHCTLQYSRSLRGMSHTCR